jgi:hypothetical protein
LSPHAPKITNTTNTFDIQICVGNRLNPSTLSGARCWSAWSAGGVGVERDQCLHGRRGFEGHERAALEPGRLAIMTTALLAVLEQARRLTPEEQLELARQLLASVDPDEVPVSERDWIAVWRPELDRRRALLERGELETIDARQAITEARARIRADTK